MRVLSDASHGEIADMRKPAQMLAPIRAAMGGLRVRVVLWYLGLFMVALFVAVVALSRLLTVGLDDSISSSLSQEVEELRLLTEGTDPKTGEPFDNDVEAIFDTFTARNVPSTGEGLFFLVDGEPYTSSRGAPVDLLDDPELVATWASASEPTSGQTETAAGPVRWLAVPVNRGEQTSGTFIVGRFYQPELSEISQAVQIMALISGGILLAVSLIGWLTVGGAVAPIRRLTRTAQRISDSDLSERLPVTGHDEVAELTQTFNNMLDRLQGAFVDQRRFLDDIGHELRTPLTIVRGNLELLPDDRMERQQTISLCLDELDRMNRYVTELILLAKAEKPDFLRFGPVDLAELTSGMHTRAVGYAPDRTWQIDDAAHAVIEADPDRLNQAWLNLVTNAVQHTGSGGFVALGSAVIDGEARLWVRDDGPGVNEQDKRQIFERFQRGHDIRSERAEGTGLGLAIVAAIARAHGGRVTLNSRVGQGARFTILVPTTRPAVVDDEAEVTAEITRKVGDR